jgi:long-chain acyl-CoA synthetase
MLNLSVVLEDAAREVPDRDAVVFGEMRLSYAMVDTIAAQVANLLTSWGVGPGDKVALACPNLPYVPMVYFGILKAGATVVPLNVLLNAREIAYHLDDSDAKAIFCFEGTPELPLGERGWAGFADADHCEHFVALPATPLATESTIDGATTLWAALDGVPGTFDTYVASPEDTAVVLYTSGTTGQPKGAELTHANMLMNAIVSDSMFPAADHDVFLGSLPLFHSFGQTVVMNTAFYRRGTIVLQARFSPAEALELMEREKVTFFAGVPTMYWALLSYPKLADHDVQGISDTLNVAVSGGSALPLEVLRGVKERFGIDVLEGYGLSETAPVASFNRPDRPTKPVTIGVPIWGVQMKLVGSDWADAADGEAGEIAVKGHNVMKGYYGRPDATADVLRDGWFRTGDIATRDADGYYTIVDRAKDMIIRGGFNVYPRELEEVLMTHPQVSLAAVVGIPNDSHGEEIKAYVIRTPDATVTEDELIAWGQENMAAYKYPRVVEFREDLPMTATGKILKRELR